VSLDGTVSLLPDIFGSGTVTGLLQATQIQKNSSDTTLQGYLQSFVSATDDTTRNSLVDEIIYQSVLSKLATQPIERAGG
jgi:hypothetical protein